MNEWMRTDERMDGFFVFLICISYIIIHSSYVFDFCVFDFFKRKEGEGVLLWLCVAFFNAMKNFDYFSRKVGSPEKGFFFTSWMKWLFTLQPSLVF